MSKKHKWKGDEFKQDQKAKIDWGGSAGLKPCKVLYWSKDFGGWWYVQLQNGGLHYTRNLVKKG